MNVHRLASKIRHLTAPRFVIEPDKALSIGRQYLKALVHQDDGLTTPWLGREVSKTPSDLLTYAEIIHRCRPDFLIETGTLFGGSAYFFATMMDLVGHGQVISIDIHRLGDLPKHPRITYLTGNSSSAHISLEVLDRIGIGNVMVSLDSDHHADHVTREIESFAPLVSKGHYLVVEDIHPELYPECVSGPQDAIDAWDKKGFVEDPVCQRYLTTTNAWFIKQ